MARRREANHSIFQLRWAGLGTLNSSNSASGKSNSISVGDSFGPHGLELISFNSVTLT